MPVDVSPVAGDPNATIQKMRIVKRAAMVPAEPSGQDRAVAARAAAEEAKARNELSQMKAEEAGVALAGAAFPRDRRWARSLAFSRNRHRSPIGHRF